jgi:uncharacterized SAM-binding protein YcdF (DUF218 family)
MHDGFFNASKLGWLVLAPSNALVLIAALGAMLWLRVQSRRLGGRLFVVGGAGLLAATRLPLGEWLTSSLEDRFPPLQSCVEGTQPPAIAGIIVLGGAMSSIERNGAALERMGDASDRIRSAALLARAFPQAPVLIAGGVTFPTRGSTSESQLMADLLTDLGVDRERQILEGASRTTADNARNAAAASPNSQAPWLLVTSAFHMPRAVGAFRAEGLAVIAAPTDWQIDPHAPWQGWSASERLRLLDLSVKEYLGMLAYYLTGRSSELIPAPSQTGCLAH